MDNKKQVEILSVVKSILESLLYAPDMIDVGRDIWKRLKRPSELGEPKTKNGIVGNTFYSGKYKFQISIPDDNWRFWEPTPQYIASLGTDYTLPNLDVPIIILSTNMIRLYRPIMFITVEDVGTFTSIQELAQLEKMSLETDGYLVDQENVKIQSRNNSAGIIATGGTYLQRQIVSCVEMIYLRASKAFYIQAHYVPDDPETPQMFGGMQDILSSFKLIK